MNTTIIFSHSYTGHVLEYFQHLYNFCLEIDDKNFIFVVPEEFKENRKMVAWREASNISFDYISHDETNKYKGVGFWRFSYNVTLLLRKRAKKYKANKVFSLFWFPLVPFGVFLLPSYTKISAIFYDIYLRDLEILSKKAILKNKLFFSLLATSSRIDKCFILNDEANALQLNEMYHTNKFVFIPDPYKPINANSLENLRLKYNIPNESIVFAHFGGLAKRKGTLNILKSIACLSDKEKSNCFFIFAGIVVDEIRAEFYNLLSQLKGSANIIVEDCFCSYEFLASLCTSSNVILMPYLYANRSSGLLGYASQFNTPVIAPNKGLLSEIIIQYKLGLVGNCSTPIDIACMVRQYLANSCKRPTNAYCLNNNVKNFCKTIKQSL